MMRSGKSVVLMAAVVLSVALAFALSAYAEDATYVGNSQCKICHNKKDEGEPWAKWKASKHATAFATLSTDAAKEAATKKGVTKPAAEAPECLKCHVTGYDAAKGVPEKIMKEDGIQCESCHGPASLHIAAAKKFKSGDKSANPSAAIKKGDEATCKTCHNSESPTAKAFDFKAASETIAHKNPNKK